MKNINDELANDRTFLAWLRTGIALFGLGFVVAKIAYLIDPDASGLSYRGSYTAVGVLIVLSGAGIVLVGLWQHHTVRRAIERSGDETHPWWPLVISFLFTGGSVVLSVLMVASA